MAGQDIFVGSFLNPLNSEISRHDSRESPDLQYTNRLRMQYIVDHSACRLEGRTKTLPAQADPMTGRKQKQPPDVGADAESDIKFL